MAFSRFLARAPYLLAIGSVVALSACSSGADSGDSANQETRVNPVTAKLSEECQSPLAVELSNISIHADDPKLVANFDLALKCSSEAAAVLEESRVVKADRIIEPIDGLINFETPHVHPIDLTPNGNTLVAVNTAAHTLEVWNVNGSALTAVASIPVGIDPVSVRARTNNEVWVVNHISDSVSIVDLAQQVVVRTLKTLNEPADVVFAGNSRAFVSASESNAVEVFNLNNLNAAPQNIAINGEDPRALAVSSDGQTVYAAVFESGNSTRQTGTAGSAGNIIRDFSIADNDVAIIDANALSVTYRRRLMNMVMSLSVHPTTGEVVVVGTEAFNDIANEPALNGKFIQVQTASFSGAGVNGATITDLNPHLDYTTPTVSVGQRALSIGDPRGIAWRANGQRAFITGLGSNNVIVINQAGDRVTNFAVGEGPTGIVLKDSASLGFVMNKFDGSISVIDLDGTVELSRVAFDDPTDPSIKAGRPFLYDTHLTSGTGHLSCASCHVDGRTDRLGWQLSDGLGSNVTIPEASNSLPGNLIGTTTISSNKDVMVTQTLVDIMEHPRFHWRGDRESIDDFNGTYTDLMGRPSEISAANMSAMKDYLRTLWLPPNPYRNIDNSRPSTVTLPDGSTATSNRVGSNTTDALRGGGNGNNCLICHSGQANATRNFGANAEIGSNIIAPALPALYDKMGFTFGRSGFGFFHHGGADLFGATRTREFLAEILTLEGPEGPLTEGEIRQAPHAGMGQQVTIGSNPTSADLARVDELIGIANSSIWAELVAHTVIGGLHRGFALDTNEVFDADIAGQTRTKTQLLAGTSPVTFTVVGRGMSVRLALDSDLDGVLNNDIDTDGDGLTDAVDPDDDNDGVQDGQDAFPLDANESVDTDADGIGNNADNDDDNDGVQDGQDAFPLNANESVDTDGDGIGNNADTDDDNDGVLDVDDLDPLDPNVGNGGGTDNCNLVQNSSFESGLGNWVSNASPELVNDSFDGANALRFGDGFLGQTIVATPGTLYTFSGQYKSAGSTGWAGYGVDFVDANGSEVGELVRTLTTTGTYTTFNLQALVPANATTIRPWFYADAGRTLTLDELDLRKTGCTGGGVGNQAPFVANPGNQVNTIGQTINLTIVATDPDDDALTLTATNLPVGLSMSTSGVITGSPSAAGTSSVTIFADDGQNTSQASFNWVVTGDSTDDNCNLLRNGDFESGMQSWTSSVNPTVTNDAISGSAALRFSDGWIAQTVPAAPGKNYSVSAQYKSTNGSQWNGWGIDYLDASGNEIGEELQTLAASNSYQALTLAAVAPPNTASMRIWFYAQADRTLTLDSIDLRETGCTGGTANACNAVTNPNFEDTTGGWFTNTTPSLVTDAGEGNRSIRVTDGYISQPIPATAGTEYVATALAKSFGAAGFAGGGLDFTDANGVKLDSTVVSVLTANAYAPIQINGIAPAGTTAVRIWFYADTDRAIQVDEVSVSEVGCQ
jgi:6-phosphogluconolactonase (cycloisomerase 2 family)